MQRVTSTKQLTRGQKVVVLNKYNGFRVDYYKFISEDLANDEKLKEQYGYFVDLADQPKRFYLSDGISSPVYKDYTDEDLLKAQKEYHENELADIEQQLNKLKGGNQ